MMDSHNLNQSSRVRCTSCNEQIMRNQEIVLNRKTICLGCALDKGVLQMLDTDINHKLSCKQKAGTGKYDCHYCYVMTYGLMQKLGYEITNNGTWFKRTDFHNVFVIYE